jgi:hypothetical protein
LGTWGLFRVTKQAVVIEKAHLLQNYLTVNGSIQSVTTNGTGQSPKKLQIFAADASHGGIELGKAEVDSDGKWSFRVKTDLKEPATIQVTAVSDNGDMGATTFGKIVP